MKFDIAMQFCFVLDDKVRNFFKLLTVFQYLSIMYYKDDERPEEFICQYMSSERIMINTVCFLCKTDMFLFQIIKQIRLNSFGSLCN